MQHKFKLDDKSFKLVTLQMRLAGSDELASLSLVMHTSDVEHHIIAGQRCCRLRSGSAYLWRRDSPMKRCGQWLRSTHITSSVVESHVSDPELVIDLTGVVGQWH